MNEQKYITLGELREQTKDLPDDCKIVIKYFDLREMEIITLQADEIYSDSNNQLILRG
jgi:hypothetical protein